MQIARVYTKIEKKNRNSQSCELLLNVTQVVRCARELHVVTAGHCGIYFFII